MVLLLNKCEQDVIKNLRSNGIRIGMIADKGRVNHCEINSVHYCEPGHVVRTAQVVFEMLGISIDKQHFVMVNHTRYGIDGLLGEIINGTYDTGVPQFAITPERSAHVLFSESPEMRTAYIQSR